MGVSHRLNRSVMSADLVWMCVRKNSSFLVKRDNQYFTSEPNNLTGKNSFRYSGLARSKAIGLEAGEKGVVLTVKTKHANKPNKLSASKTLKKDIRRVVKSIRNATDGYRADLEGVALARATALFRAKRSKANGVKQAPHRRSKSDE